MAGIPVDHAGMAWIILGCLFLLAIAWLFFKARLYIPLFAPMHYVEFANLLTAAVEVACVRIDEPPSESLGEDPRHFVTSAGIAFFYTITTQDGLFVHQFSVSIAGRYTPRAIGGTFAVYVARLLDIEIDQLQMGVSQNMAYHIIFVLDEQEQADFESREITVPTEREASALHSECLKLSPTLECEPYAASGD